MQVKKFEAKSMKEALQMVKKELGPDAVILAARDNRKSFGINGQASVEVTAAVSEGTLQKKRFVESRMTNADRERFSNSDARTQRQIIDKMVDRRVAAATPAPISAQETRRPARPITSTSYIDIGDEEEEMQPTPRRQAAFASARGRNVNELLEDFERDFENEEPIPETRSAQKKTPSSDSAMERIRNAAREVLNSRQASSGAGMDMHQEESAETETTREARQSKARSERDEQTRASRQQNYTRRSTAAPAPVLSVPLVKPEPKNGELDVLKNEIQRLQGLLDGYHKTPTRMPTLHPGADYGLPYDLSFMYQKLVEAGISVDNTVEILQTAAAQIDPVQLKKRSVVDTWVARWLLDNTMVVQNPLHARIHLFVGGAGSGKTSALVKAASQLVVKEKKKIAILSTDAFKVGAVDQMKIYCQILNVPFAVIRNRNDWNWVLNQLQHVDHILVDYPGLQLRDIEEIQLLRSLMPPEGVAVQTHICVPTTAKDGDAFEMARRYQVTNFNDIIFTNLDQSVQHGLIYNLQKKTGRPLHSFGIGNRIPEDFEVATKERVLDLIFKLTKLKRESSK